MNLRQRQSHEKGAHRKLHKRWTITSYIYIKKHQIKGFVGFLRPLSVPREKSFPINRQIVYPQVYVLPLIGGYESTTKTITRKRGSQKTLQKTTSQKPPHQKSNKGLFGLSEVFECLSEKKPPYKRQIVYLVYPQVYVLPLIGGYKSTTKTIARKRVTQKALDRKKSNKELFGFCGCRLILELPARYVGIHICGSFEVFECLSGKKPPPIIGKSYTSYTPRYTFYLL